MAIAHSCETISHAVHLSIEMQNVFSPGAIWPTPWMDRVVPGIARLVARHAARTAFTRFITPLSAEDRPGRWRRYFARWDCATSHDCRRQPLKLCRRSRALSRLRQLSTNRAIPRFYASALQSFLAEKNVNTLIISGSETDVCVLATVLDAVDRGFRSSWRTGFAVHPIRARRPDDALSDALHRSDRTAHTECGPRILARRSMTTSVHRGPVRNLCERQALHPHEGEPGNEQRDAQRRSAPAHR
jgi:nicotinamidase-related amidase